MSADDCLCLDSASTFLDQHLASPTYSNTSTMCDPDLEHDLLIYFESNIGSHGNTMDFMLKCWRVLLSSFVYANQVPAKLTYGSLWRMFALCVAPNFPVFATHYTITAHVTYENAYAILKRAHEILVYLAKHPNLEKRRQASALPTYLSQLHINNNPNPHSTRVIAEVEWLFLLRSWFRWNKTHCAASVFLVDNHVALAGAIAPFCIDNCNVLEHSDTSTTNDVATNVVTQQKEEQCEVAVATQHKDEAVVNQYLQAQLDDYRAQQTSLFCCCVDAAADMYIIYSKYDRLNPIERACENKIDRVRFLLQRLQQSQHKLDIQEDDRYCVIVRVEATQHKIVNYDIVQWTQITDDMHKMHVK